MIWNLSCSWTEASKYLVLVRHDLDLCIPIFSIPVSVVVAFFVCWAPFHAQRLLAIYAQGTKSKTLILIYDSLNHISGILYFLSTCTNPILYNIMSNKFRQAFKVRTKNLVYDTLLRLRKTGSITKRLLHTLLHANQVPDEDVRN